MPRVHAPQHAAARRSTPQFDAWIAGLRDRQVRRRIAARLLRVEGGNLGDAKRFDGLIELRIDHGPGYRIYACQRGAVVILLLCGGDKSSQERDIALARSLARKED